MVSRERKRVYAKGYSFDFEVYTNDDDVHIETCGELTLDRECAAELAAILQRFAETGRLEE